MGTVLVILVGILGGIAAGFQSQFVGILDDRVGTLGSTLITYGGGGLLVGIVFLATRGTDMGNVRTIPWWAYAAGVMGLIVIASLSVTISNLGVGKALTVFTATSILTAAVIDQYGWMGATVKLVDLSRGAGIVLLLVGTWLVVR